MMVHLPLVAGLDAVTVNGVTVSDEASPLAGMVYQLFNEGSYQRFLEAYANCDVNTECSWAFYDYGKAALDGHSQLGEVSLTPVRTDTYVAQLSDTVLSIVSNNSFPTTDVDYHALAGTPAQIWMEYLVDSGASKITITITLLDKTGTRIPEALWLVLNSTSSATFTVNKLGVPINPTNVVYNGSSHLHGTVYNVANDVLNVTAHNSPLVCVGSTVTPFPSPMAGLDMSVYGPGLSYNLVNNIWGTAITHTRAHAMYVCVQLPLTPALAFAPPRCAVQVPTIRSRTRSCLRTRTCTSRSICSSERRRRPLSEASVSSGVSDGIREGDWCEAENVLCRRLVRRHEATHRVTVSNICTYSTLSSGTIGGMLCVFESIGCVLPTVVYLCVAYKRSQSIRSGRAHTASLAVTAVRYQAPRVRLTFDCVYSIVCRHSSSTDPSRHAASNLRAAAPPPARSDPASSPRISTHPPAYRCPHSPPPPPLASSRTRSCPLPPCRILRCGPPLPAFSSTRRPLQTSSLARVCDRSCCSSPVHTDNSTYEPSTAWRRVPHLSRLRCGWR